MLAVAFARGWRPAVIAAFVGLALLVLMVLVGPLLDRIPLHLLQLVIGVLLLLSGMRWLRKAILRAVWQELDQPPSTGKLSASQSHHHGSGRA